MHVFRRSASVLRLSTGPGPSSRQLCVCSPCVHVRAFCVPVCVCVTCIWWLWHEAWLLSGFSCGCKITASILPPPLPASQFQYSCPPRHTCVGCVSPWVRIVCAQMRACVCWSPDILSCVRNEIYHLSPHSFIFSTCVCVCVCVCGHLCFFFIGCFHVFFPSHATCVAPRPVQTDKAKVMRTGRFLPLMKYFLSSILDSSEHACVLSCLLRTPPSPGCFPLPVCVTLCVCAGMCTSRCFQVYVHKQMSSALWPTAIHAATHI